MGDPPAEKRQTWATDMFPTQGDIEMDQMGNGDYETDLGSPPPSEEMLSTGTPRGFAASSASSASFSSSSSLSELRATRYDKDFLNGTTGNAAQTHDTDQALADLAEDVPLAWPRWRAEFRRYFFHATWLHHVFTAAIVLNCIILAMYDPLDKDHSNGRKALTVILNAGDAFCSILYFLEMCFKIIAMGFFEYLGKKWNVVDGVIAIVGIVAMIPVTPGSLDVVKMIRPLKLLNAIPTMERIMNSLIESIATLFYVAVLYFFFSLGMGIIGVQQWEGLFLKRCLLNETRFYISETGSIDGYDSFTEFSGIINGMASAAGETDMNLSVLQTGFAALQGFADFESNLTLLQKVASTDAVYEDETVCKTLEEFSSFGGFYCPYMYDCLDYQNLQNGWLSFDHIGVAMLTLFLGISLEGWTTTMYQTMNATSYFAVFYWIFLILIGSYFLMNLTLLIIAETFNSSIMRAKAKKNELKKIRAKRAEEAAAGDHTSTSTSDDDIDGDADLHNFYLKSTGVDYKRLQKKAEKPKSKSRLDVFKKIGLEIYLKLAQCGAATRPQALREKLNSKILRNVWFRRFLIFCIVVNTVTLSAEYQGQSERTTQAFNILNIILTFIFTMEIFLKLYVGMRRYIKDPFNLLDIIIVVSGLLEFFMSGEGSISALRSLRVLRVIRLATYFKQLQKWVHILMSAFRSVLYIVLLLLFLIFVGAIWGMMLFGGGLCEEAEEGPVGVDLTIFQNITVEPFSTFYRRLNGVSRSPTDGRCKPGFVNPRYNFDTLHNSILVTFQIITGEDWNTLLYLTMDNTSWLAGVYGLSIFIGGNYLILNLFVAALLCRANGEPMTISGNKTPANLQLRQVAFASLSPQQLEELRLIDEEQFKHRLLHYGVKRSMLTSLGRGFGAAEFAECDDEVLNTLGITDQAWRLKLLRLGNALRNDPDGFMEIDQHIRYAAECLHPLLCRIHKDFRIAAIQDDHNKQQDQQHTLSSYIKEQSTLTELAEPLYEEEMASFSSVSHEQKPTELTHYRHLCDPEEVLHSVASYGDDPRVLQQCLIMKYPRYASESKYLLKTWIAAYDAKMKERDNVATKVSEMLKSNKDFDASSAKVGIDAVTSVVEAYDDAPMLLVEDLKLRYVLLDREILFLEDWKSERDAREQTFSEFYKMMREYEASKHSFFNTFKLAQSDNALFIFPRSSDTEADSWATQHLIKFLSQFRSCVIIMCDSRVFEWFMVLVIMASTVCLAIDTPLRPPDHPQEVLIEKVQFVTMCVFASETLLKSIAYGFFLNEDAYLHRDMWNRLDLFITVTSIIGEMLPLPHSGMDLHRSFRMLRPLRFINRLDGVKVVFTAILSSLPPLMNVTLLSLVVWLIFAIVGLQQFSGRFHKCTDKEYGDMDGVYSTRIECIENGWKWANADANFDDIGHAFLTLFQVASLEGWPTVMYNSIDAVSYDVAPQKDRNPYLAYYYIIFIIFGSFVIVNLFIGVLIDTFTAQKQSVGKSLVLSPGQERWVRVHSEMLQMVNDELSKDPPTNIAPFRQKLHRIVTTRKFDLAIAVCIGINIVVMALEHHPSSEAFDVLAVVVNDVMLGVFALEVAAKVIALGPKAFFKSPWCRFDLVIVLSSAAPFIIVSLLDLFGSHESTQTRVNSFRALQLLRLLKMMRASRGIRRMLKTLFLSVPSLFNVSAVVALLLFVYAVCQRIDPLH